MVLFDGLEVAVNGGKGEEGVRSPNVPFIVFGICLLAKLQPQNYYDINTYEF